MEEEAEEEGVDEFGTERSLLFVVVFWRFEDFEEEEVEEEDDDEEEGTESSSP